MRRINQPVRVLLDEGGPARITFEDQTLVVQELILCWVYQTRWWAPGGDERRVYYRLQTNAGVVEVYRKNGRDWVLTRIAD